MSSGGRVHYETHYPGDRDGLALTGLFCHIFVCETENQPSEVVPRSGRAEFATRRCREPESPPQECGRHFTGSNTLRTNQPQDGAHQAG